MPSKKLADFPAKKLSDTLTTAIHLPRGTWELLREVAFARARTHGGRASVSKVLVDLVESARKRLEEEIAR